MNKNIIIWVLIAALVTSLGFWLFRSDGVETKTIVERQLGAVASPEIISNYLKWGGYTTWRFASGIRTATSTICSFLTPPATTTLKHYSFRPITATTSTAFVLALATSTTLTPSLNGAG